MTARTALGTGERRKKYDLRVAAYGTLDEANAAIGIARLHTGGDATLDAALARIQNDLFDVGADLCTPGKGKGPDGARLTVTQAQVDWLESEIDRLNDELAPLKSFVLPGGSAGRGLSASRPHHLPARRAADRRAQGQAGRERRRRGAEIRQPAVRFPVRRQPLCQWQRRARRAVAAGPKSLTAEGASHGHADMGSQPVQVAEAALRDVAPDRRQLRVFFWQAGLAARVDAEVDRAYGRPGPGRALRRRRTSAGACRRR